MAFPGALAAVFPIVLSSVLRVALTTPGRAGEHHSVVDDAEDLNYAVRTDPIQYKMS
jgi:hypothetical protein